ncbi:MAG: hypothetical protein JWM05_1758 [Acidimicrobiales bacterium]|nr:hypothetical protein [Acidimicrobiales bacterium]
MHRRSAPLSALVLTVALVLGGGCSKTTRDKAKDAAKSAEQDATAAVDQAKARAVAEAIRLGLKTNKTAKAKGLRSVVAIKEVVDNLPGNPTITGILDANGDGLDDDGKVQVEENAKFACLTLPATGTDTTVNNGRC